MKRIVIIAGDKSADLYGGLLSKKLKEKFNDNLEIFSFGGPSLAQYSKQKINLLQHSVSGIFEVLFHLPDIFNTFNKTLKTINEIKPDLVILMDFPDFNLRLAKKINKRFPVFYYISPQVWAWRKNRIKQIKKYIEKMIVIFKFEEDFYKRQGIDALYFGHPLLEIIKKENVEAKKIISLLPGSRKNEITRNLPLMLAAKSIIEAKLSDYSFRIIRPAHIEESFYKRFDSKTEIVAHSYNTLCESKFIIAASGTATVEIAILEIPYLIIYKINPLTFSILQKMVDTKFIGMVNILSSKRIIQELLQDQANPQTIAKETLECIGSNDRYQQIKSDLKGVKDRLAPYGATQEFADFIGDYLGL
jgi:lipid-A-disaccharide synthase